MTRLALFALLALFVSNAIAEDRAPAGRYVFEPRGSDDIAAAIETTVAKMNFIKRPIARSRLKKTNDAYSSVAISYEDTHIVVEFNGKAAIRMPANGTRVQWRRDDGEVFEVAARHEGATLIQTFQAKDGERKNAFRMSADGGMLLLDVTLSSDQLPAPLTYRLAYRRG